MTVPAVPIRNQLCVYAIGTFCFSSQQMLPLALGLMLVAMDTSALLIGVILGSREVISVLFAIHGGAMMDRFGARKVVIVVATVATVTTLLYPLAAWVPVLILLQMVNGFSSNTGWLGAQTLVAGSMGGDPAYSGRLTFAIRIGILTGPPLTGFFYDHWGPWGGFAFLSAWAIGALLAALWLPRPENGDADGDADGDARPADLRALIPAWSDYRDAFALLRKPMIVFVTGMSMLIVVTQGVQQGFYVVLLKSSGYSGSEIGILIAIAAVLGAVGALGLGRLLHWFSPVWLLLFTGMGSILLICSTPIWGSYLALFLVSTVRGGMAGINQPLMITLVSRAVSRSEQGKAVGLRSSANRLSHIIIPVFMGVIAEYFGIVASFYVVGAAVLTLMALLGVYAACSKEIESR